jgi:hypothetical protein
MRKLLFLSCFLSVAGVAVAQKDKSDSLKNLQNQYIIRFDVKNGNVYMPNKPGKKADSIKFTNPKVGQFIRIIFENVPKDYKVGADALFVDKNLENAGTFQTFLSKNEEKVNEDKKSKQNQTETKIDSTDNKIKEAKIEQEKIGADIKNEIEKLTESLSKIIKQLEEVKDEKETGHLIQAVDKNAKEIRKIANEIKDENSDLSGKVDLILKEVEKILKGENKTVELVKAYRKSVAEKVIYDNENLRQRSSDMVKFKAKYDSILGLTQNLLSEKDSMLNLFKTLAFERRVELIQPIQVENRDFTQLAIRYTNDKNETTAREITLKNRRGFKIDFSTGFIGTGLVDENYRVEPKPNSTDTGFIRNDPKGNFAIGFALLSHAYFRTGKRVNVSLNAGLMLNGGNQTVNYITGVSVPLGLEQRFIISAGAAFGKVKTLTKGYEEDKSYRGILTTGVPYTDKWRGSWFIGITYNIAGLAGNSQAKVVQGKKE